MIALWMVLGALLGAASGLSQRWTVSQLRAGEKRHALSLTLGGMAIRLALAAGLLIASLRHGALAGIAAFGGLLLVRSVIVIWAHVRGWPRRSVMVDDHSPEAQNSREDAASHHVAS